ncbi:hypothetical protein, partial, partial [Absidia glauca]
EQNMFHKAIQPQLATNQSIPSSSFCTLDIAIVRLPTNNKPTDKINYRQYPLPFRLFPVVEQAVQTWLKEGTIIRAPVNTSWNSPITLAPKKDEYGNVTGKRPCLDPRHINKFLPDDNYPLPLIKDIFHQLTGATVFTTLDLKSAFHRFLIHPEDQHKTTFTHNGRQYMFQGCPFGLKPLSSKFQRVMHYVFDDMPFVHTFVDDVIIHSTNMQEHVRHVSIAIAKLTAVNLVLNPKKCHFAQRSVYLLGFCITAQGIYLDKRKLSNLKEWPTPQSGHDIQKFLGVVNYFREHVPNITSLTYPLDALRHASTHQFTWSKHHDLHFTTIKKILLANPVLCYPDLTKPFCVTTDASNHGIGAVLFQRTSGQIHHIGFMARALSKSERNYSTTKRELLAIIFALKKFHQFLWANPFKLYTDHKALTFIHTQSIANPMMINWLDTLLDYTFEVIHLPGIDNTLPDCLSRLFSPLKELGEGKACKPNVHKINKRVRDIQHHKPHFTTKHIIQMIHTRQPQERITPPERDRHELLNKAHLFGHFGAEAIIKSLHNDGLHWTNMMQDALEIVKTCPQCQKHNVTRQGFNPLRPVYAYLPGDHWAMDLTGPFTVSDKNNTYLLVMVDVCTRFCILRALPNKQSDTIVNMLVQVFSDFGYPRILQSDNGREFKNEIIDKLT